MADLARPPAVAVRPAGDRRGRRDRRQLRRAARERNELRRQPVDHRVRARRGRCRPLAAAWHSRVRRCGRRDRAPSPTSAAAATVTEPRPPSVLGRWTLAVALLVGAAGAIGYQLNGDGLHPERWLGAAAVVCGIGIVVGAWRGRALWLVVPGLLFAGSGFVAGHAARAGIDGLEVGTRYPGSAPSGRSAYPKREDLVAGKIEVTCSPHRRTMHAFGPTGRPRRDRHHRRR